MNRFVDALGGAVQRAQSAERSELEIQLDRVREDQRLTEDLLQLALREIAALKAQVAALQAGGVGSVAPSPVAATPVAATPVAATPVAATPVAAKPVAPPAAAPPAPAAGPVVPIVAPAVAAVASPPEVLDIDRNECIGCGTCVEHEGTVFLLNEGEGKAYVIRQDGDADGIQDAIDACPVTCISWQPAPLVPAEGVC